jgi:PTH1 family peptidyl-tRNA hydrolase
MKICVGLGNPGNSYQYTRHNIGFLFLDFIAHKYALSFSGDKKYQAEKAIWKQNNEEIFLIKPQTFMNLSGLSLQKFVSFYKISLKNICIISDDKDMEFGKLRFKETGSAGGHNGLKNIFSLLGEDIPRLKCGIQNTSHILWKNPSDFVLSSFTEEEKEHLFSSVFPEMYALLQEKFLT